MRGTLGIAAALLLGVASSASAQDADGHGPDPGSAEDMAAQARRQLARIAEIDDAPDGPRLNAVIVANPKAPEQAAALA